MFCKNSLAVAAGALALATLPAGAGVSERSQIAQINEAASGKIYFVKGLSRVFNNAARNGGGKGGPKGPNTPTTPPTFKPKPKPPITPGPVWPTLGGAAKKLPPARTSGPTNGGSGGSLTKTFNGAAKKR